ncbi:hypothetical protein JCM16814_04660 [Desulfobaculum senezii]
MEQFYEQKRAAYALECVKRIANKKESEIVKAKYRTAVRGLGPSVIMSGLGQSLSTLYARGERKNGDEGAKALLGDVIRWVVEHPVHQDGWKTVPHHFFKKINDSSRDTYNLVQVEVIALLEWLSKYAVAMLPNPNDVEERSEKQDKDGGE